MRVLLDSCVWSGAKAVIAEAGHEVEWVGDWPTDPGDEEILTRAATTGAVLVTIDKDFGALARYGAELGVGALVTVERTRVRVRPADPPRGDLTGS